MKSLFSSRRLGAAGGSSSKSISTAHARQCVEGLESRLLFAVNAWKAGVSGNWTDATKWSLGHVPTVTEDVTISAPGTYTVTVPTDPTGVNYYYEANSIKVGGATGTQTLVIQKGERLYAYKAFSVGAGDVIDIKGGGRFLNYSPDNTANQVDGTILLGGDYGTTSYLSLGGSNVTGTGQIVLNTGGPNSLYANYISGNNYTLGSGITLRGKGGVVSGNVINKGTIKLEGGTTDSWQFASTLNNQGVVNSPGGSTLQIYGLTNAAGKSINITGGTLDLRAAYSNAGTINATNAKLNYNMTFTSPGVVNRTNSTVYFGGIYDGNGGAFRFDSATGTWILSGGTFRNGSFNPNGAFAPVINAAQSINDYGIFDKVTLTGDLSIPAGFYFNVYNGLTLSNVKVSLNGNSTVGASGLYTYSTTLGGTGEIIFNTASTTNSIYNSLNGNSWTLGSGILVHGKGGKVGGGFTNAGTILADTPGERIQIYDVVNKGGIIAAPGKIIIDTFNASTGALTIGIGGTTAGSSFGQIQFNDFQGVVLGGTINTVALNGYTPAVNSTYKAVLFNTGVKSGTFLTKNLDAGNSIGFDLTQTNADVTLKAKNTGSAFATRDNATGAVKVNGTSAADTITLADVGGVIYAKLGTKTSVFLDRAAASVAIFALAGADTVTISGNRGISVFGSDGNDTLTGGGGNDSLDGGNNNDSILGNGGNDTLVGGEGNDTAAGGSGNDIYAFGAASAVQTDTVVELTNAGTDTLTFSALGTTTNVKVNLGSDTTTAVHTNRTVKTGAAGQAAFFENVTGGAGNDTITGNGAKNTLLGNAGNDSIVGGSGDDVLDGGSGTDTLVGGLGNDKLTGGSGSDLLKGDDNNDTLYGSDGATDTLDGGLGTDVLGSSDASDVKLNIP